jgi:hypothetical protein
MDFVLIVPSFVSTVLQLEPLQGLFSVKYPSLFLIVLSFMR